MCIRDSLDTKRMNRIYDVNTESLYIECGTGAIYKHIEWEANQVGYATMHYPLSLIHILRRLHSQTDGVSAG